MSVATPTYEVAERPSDARPPCPRYYAAHLHSNGQLAPVLRSQDVVLLADHEAALAAVTAKLQHITACMHALQRYEPDEKGKLRPSKEGRYLFVSSALAIVGPSIVAQEKIDAR